MQELDLTGLKCPLPVLQTRKKMRELEAGKRLAVITTDPMAAIDMPHFCFEDGHILKDTQKRGDSTLRFIIEKSELSRSYQSNTETVD